MGNSVLSKPETETRDTRLTEVQRDVLKEADGPMWVSLWSNLRDALMPVKQPPLQLTSQPVASTGLNLIEEEPIWKTLWNSIQDLLFPKKLPPLELTSAPIAVPDRMAVERNPVSQALSFVTHAVVLGLIFLLVLADWHTRQIMQKAAVVNVTPFIPATPAKLTMGGGGGGGNHEIVEASRGKLPKMSKTQIEPPQILRIDHPKLAVEPTIKMPNPIKLPDQASLPNLGIPQSPQVALASQGSGGGSGFGSGNGGGIGAGEGGGVGPGEGGGYGGGVYSPGGGVSEPVLLYAPDPEFSDEARRAKYQGICVVGLIVDAQGNPQQVHIVRPLGMGLDEKAMEAVRQYKFKPAMFHGRPVPVQIDIEVNFRIY
jgi:periplasmic protein TonB